MPGRPDAINKGLADATGEVLGYLNSDDVLCPGALAAVGEAFASDPDLMFAWGRASYLNEVGAPVSPYLVRPDAIDRLADACFIAQPAAFFRRKVWEEVGPFDASLHHTMDYDYWLRIAARYPVSHTRFLDREAGRLPHARGREDRRGLEPGAGRDLCAREAADGLRLAVVVRREVGPSDGRPAARQPTRTRALARVSARDRRVPPAEPCRLWGRGLKGTLGALGRRLAGG